MTEYLKKLAEQVLLAHSGEGMSKVRFTKTIYFTFKSLVDSDLANIKDLRFCRLPLGPVPVGLDSVVGDGISVTTRVSGLSYDAQMYSVSSQDVHVDTRIHRVVRKVVEKARRMSTSDLVGYSHRDQSWKDHSNGDEYCISREDLKNLLPTTKHSTRDNLDDQHLQAKLLTGMLDEIVDESTKLEYPDFK